MADFSYQLYSSRNFGSLNQTLKLVAECGYTQVEGFGGIYEDIELLQRSVEAHGLSMPTGHFSLDFVEQTPQKTLDIAKRMQMSAVLVPHIAAEHRPTDSTGWAAFGARLAKASQPFLDAGLSFGWHNHDFEFALLDGSDKPLDLILGGSDDLVLEFDLAWAAVANEDPVSWIQKYQNRLVSVHVKDIAPKGDCLDEDGWADVGHGILNWPLIMAAVRATNCQYFVMEHDNPNDDARFAARSIVAAKTF
jgi:sugar phosphate isomerase/epimerase